MYFKEIEIKNFRNYEYLKEGFHPCMNIFTGANGQGKTSLAEALYIMCLGRSFRTQKDRDMIEFNHDSAVVKAVVRKNDRDIVTEIVFNRNDKKKVKINGVKKKISELANNILTVCFSPEDLKIMKEDPDKRRRFINREISQINPGYYKALSLYTKVMTQRNSLLKSENINKNLLSVWNDELVRYGMKIISERKRFVDSLNRISTGIHSDITEGKEDLEIIYVSDAGYSDDPDELSEVFRKKLEESIESDMARGITSHGPHRDDIKMNINGVDVRKFGSQGQQRTTALSLKLAEIKLMEEDTGEKPVLILDDALSELDTFRQSYLIDSLRGIQIFLTAASVSDDILNKFREKSVFEIKNGKVIKRV